jgi:3-dehydroquinate synthase
MPAGEAAKTLETVRAAYSWLAGQRVERGDTVIALGGGVVGDLAGFVAATYLRGLRLVQAPTTLVAQVDSAIGGKVGVDLPEGKNLVGAFHQPALVLADTDLLATLPEREWRAGLAEVIKHGIIRDPGLLDVLEGQRAAILAREPGVVAALVARAGAVKVEVVMEDPLEHGLRRILNYGHTLGHAVEREAGYGVVLHGEAVAWGMAAAARIGRACGTCHEAFVAWQDDLLRAYGLLAPLPPLRVAELIEATRLDKKSATGRIRWVLPCGRGRVVITSDVPEAAVQAAASWLSGQ